MKLTRSVSYALGILLKVHAEQSERPMTAAQISAGAKFPPRFLYRVLRRLVDAGIMRGVSGPGGGYCLARPASKITLLDIVVAVEGPSETSQLEPVSRKQKKAFDAVNQLSRRANDYANQQLKRMTLLRLSKLTAPRRKK